MSNFTADMLNNMIEDNTKKIGSMLDTNDISDGYHTFGELYKHRIHLFIALCKPIINGEDECSVYKSRLHDDGTKLEGWFIVQMETPVGQISYHFPNKYWNECLFMETLDKANEWDGHTSDDVLERLLRI